jgi:hypothetical protein
MARSSRILMGFAAARPILRACRVISYSVVKQPCPLSVMAKLDPAIHVLAPL